MIAKFRDDVLCVVNSPAEREMIRASATPAGNPCGQWLVDVVTQLRAEFLKEHGRPCKTKFYMPKK